MANAADSLSAPCANPNCKPKRPKHRQQPPVYELRAERLVLCDPQGRERIVLGFDGSGTARFAMFDGEGRELATVYVTEEGDGSKVAVRTASGKTAAEIYAYTIDDPTIEGDSGGRTRITAESYLPEGSCCVAIEANDFGATVEVTEDHTSALIRPTLIELDGGKVVLA